MSSLYRRQEIRGWYSSNDSSSSNAVLQNAYTEAKLLFNQEITDDKSKRAWMQEKQSMGDVLQAIKNAKARYESRPTSKARKWLAIFSSKVMYYSVVLDVLVQHHPEYVSLAWGAMKFLFGAILNHEDMIAQLAKACSRIADMLPRTDLSLILYPTNLMKEAVAHLYARIIKFLQHAVRWYQKGKLAHAWAAIAKPWALNFKDHLDEVGEYARNVESLSSSACRAELRDTHLEIFETRAELRDARAQILQLSEYIRGEVNKVLEISLTSQTIQNQMQSDLRVSKDIIYKVQLAQILSASFLEKLPTSGESLRYCQSMQQRRRDHSKLILPNTNDLQKWADQKHSSFLVTESSTSQAAKDFLVELLQVIREARFPVLWALRFADYWESDLTCIDILRMLVLQALQINPDALTTGSNPITMTHLREAVDETDWLSILNRALQGVQQIYIVLDADLLSHVTNHNRYLATRWIEGFPRTITGTVVKLFVSRYGVDEGYASRNWDSGGWVKLRTDMMGKRPPIRSKRQKPGSTSRYNFSRAHRL